MDNRIANDMISSGMIPSGEKKKEDLGRTQYGSAPSPNALLDAYKSMYDKKEEVINEHHKKDADGNTIPHEHEEELNEGKIPAGLQAYLDKKKGKKEDKKEMKEAAGAGTIVKGLMKSAAQGAAAQLGAQTTSGLMGNRGVQKTKDKVKNLSNTQQPVAASVDLFDIVKGQLLDEGLSEEEIKDIMLTLTPDEILNEISVGKMANYISAADKEVQKTAASIKKDGSVMSDDPRVKKMTNRAQGMAVAGTKIAKKMSPPRMEEYKGSGTPEQQAAMKAQVEVSKKVNRYGGKTPSGTTAVDAKKGIEDVRKSM